MKETDAVKTRKQCIIETAIDFVKTFAQGIVDNYEEPTRAGTKKGDCIGFSKKKFYVGLLCVLYPNCLRLKEIARMAGVSEKVLLTWRTQKDFQELMENQHVSLGQMICDMIESFMHDAEIDPIKGSVMIGSILDIYKPAKELYRDLIGNPPERVPQIIELDDTKKIKVNDPAGVAAMLVLVLVYLNRAASLPWVELLKKELDESSFGYSSLGLLEMLEVHDEIALTDWEKRPEILKLTKQIIKNCIDYLADPEARKEFTVEKTREIAETTKRFIFNKLDILAK